MQFQESRQNRPQKEQTYGIYPVRDETQGIIEEMIQQEIKQQLTPLPLTDVWLSSEISDVWYLNSNNRYFIKLNGKEIPSSGETLIVSQISERLSQDLAEKLLQCREKIINDNEIDLSDLSSDEKFGERSRWDRYDFRNTLIFFLAVITERDGTRMNITRFNLDNNNLKTPFSQNIKRYFPNLEEISLIGNPINPEEIPKDVRCITSETDDDFDRKPPKRTEISQPPLDDVFSPPEIQMGDVQIAPPGLLVDMMPEERLQSKRDLNEDEFLIQSILTEYFKSPTTDIYGPTSVFSFTISDAAGSISPYSLQANECNLINPQNAAHKWFGQSNILEQIFEGQCTFDYVCVMPPKEISSTIYSTVVHAINQEHKWYTINTITLQFVGDYEIVILSHQMHICKLNE